MSLIFLLFHFFVIVGNSFASDKTMIIEEDDHSLILTDENWDYAHSIYDYMLVFFYKPDCDQCLISDEIFVLAAKDAKDTDHMVKFAFVNVSKEVGIASTEQIEAVPSVKFYRNKTGIEYLGTMGREQLVSWLTDRINYRIQFIKTINEGMQTLIHNPIVVIGCVISNNVHDVKDFEIVASMHNDVEFRLVQDSEICQHFGLPTTGNSISIYQYDFGIKHVMAGNINRKAINDFVLLHHVPIFSEFSQFIFTKSFVGHYHYFVPIIFKDLPISLNHIKAEIRSIANELDGKVIFIHFDTTKEKVRTFLEHLSIPIADGFRVVESNKHLVNFNPPNPLNLNGTYMLEFIKSVMEGQAEPDLKSSDPPENWDSHHVKHLVRKTYDLVTQDKSKTVFVLIYAPHCKYSQDVLGVFDTLGEFYRNNSDIVIAKLDSTTDELPRIRVSSTPMMHLYLKETNEMIKFVGKRTTENIRLFIETNGTRGNEPQYLEVGHLQHVKMTQDGLVHEEL